MEAQKKIENVEEKVNELMEGKKQTQNTPSIIEEARLLRDQLETIRNDLKSERENIRAEKDKLDQIQAQALLGGHSVMGTQVEKTKDQIANERAREILSIYGK